MRARFRKIRRERGAALVIVLGATIFGVLVITALLSFSFTGLKVSQSVARERSSSYAASSAIEAAIQQARHLTWIGGPGKPCPPTELTVRNATAVVTCTTTQSGGNRTLQLTARVNGVPRIIATVVIHPSVGGAEPVADVVSWQPV